MFFSILSGILIGTSYIPFTPWALFFCLIPLWSIWLSRPLSYQKIFIYGWTTQFVLSLIGFHWIFYLVAEMGKIHPVGGFVILLLFCGTQNLHIPISGLLWKYVHTKLVFSPKQSLVFLAITTALLEKTYPMIFNWNLGYPLLWMQWDMSQWADTIGFEGLSFLVLLINAQILWMGMQVNWKTLWFVIQNQFFIKTSKAIEPLVFFKNKQKFFGNLVFLMFVLIFLNVTGHFKQKAWTGTDQVLHVGAVQANIGNLDRLQIHYGHRDAIEKAYRSYFQWTDKLLKQAHLKQQSIDLVIWPEAAFPVQLDTYPHIHKLHLRRFISKHQIPILTGGYSGNIDGPQSQYYNAMFLLDQRGQLLKTYRKSILLAFGEYFPYSDRFPILRQWFPQVSHFSKGSGPQIWEWQNLKFGPQICYEGLDPSFTRKLSQKGADIIINVTNDSWYGHTFEPYQHLYMTLARAIEVRRPLVRITNTGITTAILADGTLLPQGPQQRPWVKNFAIGYTHQADLTIFTLFGKYIPFLQIALLILLTLKRNLISRVGIAMSIVVSWWHSRCRRG